MLFVLIISGLCSLLVVVCLFFRRCRSCHCVSCSFCSAFSILSLNCNSFTSSVLPVFNMSSCGGISKFWAGENKRLFRYSCLVFSWFFYVCTSAAYLKVNFKHIVPYYFNDKTNTRIAIYLRRIVLPSNSSSDNQIILHSKYSVFLMVLIK